MRVHSAFRFPIPSPRQARPVTARFLAAPRSESMLREVVGLKVVAMLTASRMVTAGLGHRGRLAGGPAVEMAFVIDVGTVLLRRRRAGTGVV